jgi:CRISPR-associated protein (TIGR02710 family)
VGGQKRTKDGVGVVESGSESVIHRHNPWDALGFQAVEDFVQLFDEGAFSSAARMVNGVLRNVEDPTRKREISVLKSLAEGYGEWDRFNHRGARKHLGDVLRGANDLAAVLSSREVFDRARQTIARHFDILAELHPENPAALVRDLLANARRRASEQRWDDATARLYRAIEATAQCRLLAAHEIPSTKRIPLDRLPAELRTEWQDRARDGYFMAGLQDAYRLLQELYDPLAERFVKLGLADREGSPLSGRNDSILAHGFTPVGEKSFRALWTCALELAECDEGDLWRFPVLSGWGTADLPSRGGADERTA